MSSNNNTQCVVCGAPCAAGGRGPARYCGRSACRQAVFRLKKKLEKRYVERRGRPGPPTVKTLAVLAMREALAGDAWFTVEKAFEAMLSVFGDEWPQDAEALAGITVAAAKRANLEDEIVAATGLSVRSIRSALKDVHGKTLLGNIIPELADDEEEEEEEEERAPGGQERFLDDETTFPVLELLGAVRAVSVRRARPLLTWLAPRVDLTVGALVSRFKNAHGRALLSTVLEDKWPVRVAQHHAARRDLRSSSPFTYRA